MTDKKARKVLVSLWSAGSCGRKQLAGILRYANDGRDWRLKLVMDPKELSAQEVADAAHNGFDGMIVFASEENAAAIAASDLPTVLMSFPTPPFSKRRHRLVKFLNENEKIGILGADYFLSLGTHASYGFMPDPLGRGWSRLRERAFKTRLHENGKTCHTYNATRQDFGEWINSLPKPTAIMCPWDFGAKEIIETCRELRLDIPRQVAVLGVDNDDLICESITPSLTSIAIDQEAIGYRAAAELEHLMNAKRDCKSREVYVPAGEIVERESTRPVSPSVNLVRRIDAFINAHLITPFGVDDIVTAMGVSRRLAELRYREITGKTIREAIEDGKLAELCRRLRSTNLPICKVTRMCGFRNELWVKYVFRRRFGMTMSEYRKEHCR